jgi:Bacterial Ig-like domain (group 1)
MKRRFLITVIAAIVTLGLTGVANATIHPTDESPVGATAIAEAMEATPGIVVSALFQTAPPLNNPNGYADSALTQFPTNGNTFGILTSGEVTNVDDPGTFTSVNDGGGPVRGTSDRDVSILQILLNAPENSNCLSFDFKFLSEEYPIYVGTAFNDAFIAELDLSTWTTAASTITAPNNFAFDADGNVVSINSTGIGGMSPAQGIGTAYDGGLGGGEDENGAATVVLSASTQITPGLHTLYLSIFDQGDNILDSAVFLDNLRIGFVPNPEVNCQPGAEPVNFQMTLEPPSDENPVGTEHCVTATLTDENGAPVGNAAIQFEVTGANTNGGVRLTDAGGQAEFCYTGLMTGDDSITACYNADASPDGSCEAFASATKTWTVGAPATVTLDPPADSNDVGTSHTVTATVRDAAGNPVPGITVRFTVTGSVNTSGSCVTDANGQCDFTYSGPAFPGADDIYAYADTNNNGVQDFAPPPPEPSGTATKAWVLPAPTVGCEVTISNGGWIIVQNGDKASFGGHARVFPGTPPTVHGNQEYQDKGPATPINYHSNDVITVVCSADRTQATMYAEGTVDGAGDHLARIDVHDLGEPGSGTTDTYDILIDTGYDSGNDRPLKGGNIQIQVHED